MNKWRSKHLLFSLLYTEHLEYHVVTMRRSLGTRLSLWLYSVGVWELHWHICIFYAIFWFGHVLYWLMKDIFMTLYSFCALVAFQATVRFARVLAYQVQ